MPEWTYIAARLNGDGTETIIDPDVPLLGPSLTKTLSGPGALAARVSPADARLIGNDGRPIFEPWSTAVFSEQDGVIHHGAIITQVDKHGPDLNLTGVGFCGAIKDQPYQGAQYFVQTDPLDIVRHIWAHWQQFPGGNLGLRVDQSTKVGTLIGVELEQVEFDTVNGPVSFEAGPYKLNEWQTDDLGGAVDKLATDHHFDYVESHAWNATRDGFIHRLDFGVPRIGRRRSDLRFVVGENVLVPPDESTESDSYASGVLVRGAGDGATMSRAFVFRPGEPRLRRIHITTDDELDSNLAAARRGWSVLAMLTGRADIAELHVRDSDHARLGSWVEGDEVEVFTDSDWGDDAMWVRILATTIEPEQPNVARLSVVRADKIPS